MQELLNAFHAHRALIHAEASHLQHLQIAARTLGLTRLADELSMIAESLEDDIETVDAALNRDITRQVKASEQASRNVFAAAVAASGAEGAREVVEALTGLRT